MQSNRVKIIGDHPWTGYYGTVIAIEKPSIGILPVMARVRLDPDQKDCDDGHECYVDRENLQILQPLKRCFRRRK